MSEDRESGDDSIHQMFPIPPLQLTADDSEFIKALNNSQISVEEVCRRFAIPRHLIEAMH